MSAVHLSFASYAFERERKKCNHFIQFILIRRICILALYSIFALVIEFNGVVFFALLPVLLVFLSLICIFVILCDLHKMLLTCDAVSDFFIQDQKNLSAQHKRLWSMQQQQQQKNALTTQYIIYAREKTQKWKKKLKTILKCIRDYCMDWTPDDNGMFLL